MSARFRCVGHSVAVLVAGVCLVATVGSTTAAQLKQATVTRIVQDVQLLPSNGSARPAAMNDTVQEKTAVRTGAESRSELTFTDQTLARLGANTIFTFNEGTRNLNLEGGVMLLRVPKNAGGARISTAAVSAAITGTTVMLEYHRHSYIKLIVMEGTARLYLRNRLGESVLVRAGQMLIVKPDAKNLPDPVDIDLARLMSTSLLIIDFPPLASQPLIAEEISSQREKKSQGKLYDTNLVIYGRGTLVSLVDPPPLDLLSLSIDAFLLSPGVIFGNEIGALNTILSPNPYVIVAGTKIKTAPLITTNGVTEQGKLYRGVLMDGSASAYFFGSTSAFDIATSFDAVGEGANGDIPMAAFKFTSLQIAGGPAIKVPSGGADNLGLISAGGITSAAPGGTVTFPGMNAVLLAAENGSIGLGSGLSFSGFNFLSLYARGAGSGVTMASQVTNVSGVSLTAEGSVTVDGNESVQSFSSFAGVDFLGGTGQIIAKNINIVAGNNIDFTTLNFAVSTTMTPGVFLQAGANVNLDVRTDQSVFTNATLVFVQGATLNFTADPGGTTLLFANLASVSFTAGSGGIQAPETTFMQTSNSMEFNSAGDIVASSIVGGDSVSAQGSVHTTGDLIGNFIGAGQDITSAGDLTGFNSVSAGNNISVTNTLLSPSVTAGGDITADHVEVQNINPFLSPITTTLTAGAGGITPFVSASGSGLQHTFNVMTIVSPNGIDFSGANFGSGSDGGILTINAQSLNFAAAGINGAIFDGAPAPSTSLPPGNGGTFTVNTAGDLTVNGSNITATTGIIDTNGTPAGVGGTINLTSSNGVFSLTNGTIQVSSADASGTVNRRASGQGGTIAIESDVPNVTAINISNTGQLLSLLSAAAPGPGGKITILAQGSGSGVSVAAQLIEADGGLVDIRQTNSGIVSLTSTDIRADIVKIAALGADGQLIISGGSISADTLLKLYAPGSAGLIEFSGSVSLNGNSMKIIAANTVRIDTSVVVTVNGNTALDVYTNNPIYTGFGGNGGTNGTFANKGANNPQPLSAAPPLD